MEGELRSRAAPDRHFEDVRIVAFHRVRDAIAFVLAPT
jgi:hypothetical protein